MFWIGLGIGLIFGGLFGVIILGLCIAAKDPEF